MKRNLILSGAHDLGFDELKGFLLSLRATGSNAHVHLFLSNCNETNRRKIESLGVTTETFSYVHFRRRRPLMLLWPFWKRMLAQRDLPEKCRLARKLFFFVSLRHVLSLDYLSRHPGEFQNVLLIDSRDSYFQSDPFPNSLEPGIHYYLEAKRQLIGKCPANRGMVLTAFGPEILKEFADFPVSCAGSTLGDEDSILNYLRTMVELLCSVKKMTASNDQGVHNFVVQRQLVPSSHLHDNYSDLIFTAGCERAEDIRMNDQDQVIRADGAPYAVLHQYDRFPRVAQKLLAKLKE